MTCDYVLSHFDAMALWDAVLDVEPDHTCPECLPESEDLR